MLLKILLGLIGLGLVVFVHELGHFIAARLSGIDVEAFSIGWGRPLFSKTIGGVEYRVGVFPVGGYCRMRGEAEFREAITKGHTEIPRDRGTFYGAAPLRRIFTALAGPAANVLFAVLLLSVVWGVGFEVKTLGNRIVLVSDLDSSARYPADEAGLRTGDRIVAVDGKKTTNYLEIQEAIAPRAERPLSISIQREGQVLDLSVTPALDTATGAGRIGVFFWTDPVVAAVAPGSTAAIAGLQSGDRLLAANGRSLPYSVALTKILEERPSVLSLDVERGGRRETRSLVLSYADDGSTDLGLEFETIQFRTPRLSPGRALLTGAAETAKTFMLSLDSLTLLFRGVDLTKAVSGPVRITYMVGDIATEGFGRGLGAGFMAVANFLALISIALCIMNLLPIPALDGGLILLFIFELLTRRPLHPKAIYVFQLVGTTLIFGLLLFSVFGDILFLFGVH